MKKTYRRLHRACDAVLERLEARALLAADFAAQVNFQPADVPTVSGYVVDSGQTYADRGNGFTYGWNIDLRETTRDRNLNSDQRRDTIIHSQRYGTGTWELSVPNGTYSVRLVAGDPSAFDSVYKINVEGTLAINTTPTSANRFSENTVSVTVSDGRLTVANASGSSNNKLAYLEVTQTGEPPVGQVPFLGSPFAVPTTIQAEDFDLGGQGVAWNDATSTNQGGAYRNTSVDIQAINDNGASHAIGRTRPGEWLEYTINVPTAGNYLLEIRAASGASGGKFHVDFNGTNKTGTINFGNTGGWGSYTTLSRTVSLSAGEQVMRLQLDASNSSQDIGNFNWLKLSPILSDATPAAPSGANADNVFSSQINVKWNDNSNNETGFVIQRRTGSGAWSTLATIGANNEFYADKSVAANTQYVYRVIASNGGTLSAPSNEASEQTSPALNWQIGANGPTKRVEGSSIEVNGKLYAFGGFQAFLSDRNIVTRQADVFNPATETWTRLADLPSGFPETHAAIATDGNAIYLMGGISNSVGVRSTVIKYDIASNSYSTLPSLPALCGGGAAAVVNGQLHFFGGFGIPDTTPRAEHWVLNLSNVGGGWQGRAAVPVARDHISTVVLDGKIYALGGDSDHGKTYVTYANVDRYDPATNQWQSLASMPVATSHHEGGTIIIDGKIVVVGGQKQNKALMTDVRAYDPSTNLWTTLKSMPSTRKGGAAFYSGGKLWYWFGEGPNVEIFSNSLVTNFVI